MVAILIRIRTKPIFRNGLMIARRRAACKGCRMMMAYGAESPRLRSLAFVLDVSHYYYYEALKKKLLL